MTPCYYCDEGGSVTPPGEPIPKACTVCIQHPKGPTVERVLQWKRNTELLAQMAAVKLP